jgi:hypothetical protein
MGGGKVRIRDKNSGSVTEILATKIPQPEKSQITQKILIQPTDSVMTPGVIVGGILLPCHQLLRVEQLPVGPSSNLVHHSRLQINKDRSERRKTHK